MPRKLRRQIDQRASRSCHRNPLVLGPLPVAEVATAVNADPTPSMAPIRGNRDMDEWWSSSLPLSSDVDPEDSPELGSAPMAEDRFGAARQNGRGPPAASRESRPSHREDPTPEPVKAPRPDSAIDLVRGETGIEKLATSDDTVLVLSEPPDLRGSRALSRPTARKVLTIRRSPPGGTMGTGAEADYRRNDGSRRFSVSP